MGFEDAWFFLVFLMSAVVPLVLTGGVVYLIWTRQRDRPLQLQADEVERLREEVSLLRDVVGDLMARMRRVEGLEEPDGLAALPPGDPRAGEPRERDLPADDGTSGPDPR